VTSSFAVDRCPRLSSRSAVVSGYSAVVVVHNVDGMYGLRRCDSPRVPTVRRSNRSR
jgi:hypothetical protein